VCLRRCGHAEDPSRPDIIAESLDLFRANALFRNFEIQGPADRLLIYIILFIGDCLTKIATGTLNPPPTRPARACARPPLRSTAD